MPLIEVLPNSTTTVAPGWAYVPDTGFDPSKAAIVPSGARKRTTRTAPIAARGALSATQQSKIAKYLVDLDKDSLRDVQIVVPNRPRDIAARGLRDKMTPGVKKILLSQKTFANHLADEEAALAIQASTPTAASLPRQSSNKFPSTPTLKGKQTPVSEMSGPKGKRASVSRPTSSSDTMIIQPPATLQDSVITEDPQESISLTSPFARSDDDNDPLLISHIPPVPSAEVIEALLSAPPLSYTAARAAPSTLSAPARQFCEICGYWGRVRCMKCATRVCSLDCMKIHDEQKCLKF